MANDVKWVKLTTDMFDNRKIKHLRKLPEGNHIVLIWVMLLTMAGRCNANGMIFLTENIPYTPKMLADELDFEESTVALALEALERFDMIVTDNGFFSIAGWEEYQNTDRLAELRERNRLAQQKSREKKKLLQGVNDVSYDSHVTSQSCQDIEEEGDEEKEFHSSILPHECGEEGGMPVGNPTDKDALKRKALGGSLGGGVVLLSDEQFSSLCDELSFDELNKYIEIIRDCELKGRHYKKKTHYQAILDMAAKDRKTNRKEG